LTNTLKEEFKRYQLKLNKHFHTSNKFGSEIDFLYGYYVGKIEEGSLHYLLKATRASAGGYVDTFEIRGIIETHKKELLDAIKSAIN
jgi:hypothetical protein